MDLTAYSLTIEWSIIWFSVSAQKPIGCAAGQGHQPLQNHRRSI